MGKNSNGFLYFIAGFSVFLLFIGSYVAGIILLALSIAGLMKNRKEKTEEK